MIIAQNRVTLPKYVGPNAPPDELIQEYLDNLKERNLRAMVEIDDPSRAKIAEQAESAITRSIGYVERFRDGRYIIHLSIPYNRVESAYSLEQSYAVRAMGLVSHEDGKTVWSRVTRLVLHRRHGNEFTKEEPQCE